jgi:hypothetical protein
MAKPNDDQIRSLLVHPALWPDLVAWLDARGLMVGQLPPGDNRVPTYTTSPKDPADVPA